MGLSVEPPIAHLHCPIPSVTDHTAWGVADGESGVPLELRFQQDQEYKKWPGQKIPNLTISQLLQRKYNARTLPSRQSLVERTESSSRGLQRNSSSPALSSSLTTMPEFGDLTDKSSQAPTAHSVPFELLSEQVLWEQDRQNSGPSFDLLCRHSESSRLASYPAHASSGEAGGDAHDESHDCTHNSGLPFELLWETDQFQSSSYKPPHAAATRAADPHQQDYRTHHVEHEQAHRAQPHEHHSHTGGHNQHGHHEPGQHAAASEMFWPEGAESACFTPVPASPYEPTLARKETPAHPPQLPLELLSQTSEWHQSDYQPLDPSAAAALPLTEDAPCPQSQPHSEAAGAHDESHDATLPRSSGLPFELLWETDQFQSSSYKPPHAAATRAADSPHDHAGHHGELAQQLAEQHTHHEQQALDSEQQHHEASTDMIWPHGAEPTCFTPVPAHPYDLVSSEGESPPPTGNAEPETGPAHPPQLPLELLSQTSEWHQSDCQPLDPPSDAAFPSSGIASSQPPQSPPARRSTRANAAPKRARGGQSKAQSKAAERARMIAEPEAEEEAASEEPELEEEEEEEGDGEVQLGEEAAVVCEGKEKRRPAKRVRRARAVKPSAPPTAEEQQQMTRYANRRKAEVAKRRKEAGWAAVQLPLASPPARGRKRGAAGKNAVKLQPLPAGSEEKPAGLLQYTLLKLARLLDRDGKAQLRDMLKAYTDGAKSYDALAADLQALVDARQLIVPLPLPLRRPSPPFMPAAPHQCATGKFGHNLNSRPGGPFVPVLPTFPGMPGFHPGMLPMGMGSGRRRNRKRKRGADRDAKEQCPVCVGAPLQDERWVKCDGCSAWYHQACVLYNELANGRKLRFFCRTPHCQKDNSRQLNRRYRQARHTTSPMLPETPLCADLAACAAAAARPDRKVVVREVFSMPLKLHECLARAGTGTPACGGPDADAAGNLNAKDGDAEQRCSCCTRRTIAALQHTVTGSDLLFMLLFVDEHAPAAGGGRAVVREVVANGLYEAAAEGEGLKVEAAMLAGYLRNLAKQGIERVEAVQRAEGSDLLALIGSADADAEQPAEVGSRAKNAWLQAVEAAKRDDVVAELSEAALRLNVATFKVGDARNGKDGSAEGAVATAAPSPKVDCKMSESAEALRAFLAARQYGFGTLQLAKYASMMLVYHWQQDSAQPAAAGPGSNLNLKLATPGAEGEEEEERVDEDSEEMRVEGEEHCHLDGLGVSFNGEGDECQKSGGLDHSSPWWCSIDLRDEGLELEPLPLM